MFGYSSYDSYFGVNNAGPYNYGPAMFPSQMVRPTGVGTIPGINAPKKNNHTPVKVVGGMAAGIATILMLLKGKGKISKLIGKLFNKKATSEGAEAAVKTGLLTKIKGLFTKKAATETTEAAGKTKLLDKIKGLFTKKTAPIEKVNEEVVESTAKVMEEGKEEAQKKFLETIKEIQSKVNNTPGVQPTDKVGQVLNIVSEA